MRFRNEYPTFFGISAQKIRLNGLFLVNCKDFEKMLAFPGNVCYYIIAVQEPAGRS